MEPSPPPPTTGTTTSACLEEQQPQVSQEPPPPPPQPQPQQLQPAQEQQQQQLSRYESQKRRDWNTFLQYLSSHEPPLTLQRCSGANIIEFLKYLDQFGKTKVHAEGCNFFGDPNPPSTCACPLKQAWGSLDALIGRLRAAYEESGGRPETNPFAARPVRIYLREVRESQAKARGIPYEKKKKKRKRAKAVGEGSSGGAGESSTVVATGGAEAEEKKKEETGSSSVAKASSSEQ